MARLAEKIKEGASAQFSDKESDEEEEVKGEPQPEKTKEKRHRKSKEQCEREAEENDLYGCLGLEKVTIDADEKMIRKAF